MARGTSDSGSRIGKANTQLYALRVSLVGAESYVSQGSLPSNSFRSLHQGAATFPVVSPQHAQELGGNTGTGNTGTGNTGTGNTGPSVVPAAGAATAGAGTGARVGPATGAGVFATGLVDAPLGNSITRAPGPVPVDIGAGADEVAGVGVPN
jgi:hypothetical protein